MSLKSFNKSAKQKLAGATAALMVLFAPFCVAQGQDANVHSVSVNQDTHCAPLEVNTTGRTLDAGLSAYRYSKKDAGSVGISIFPGSNIPTDAAHNLGTVLRAVFQRSGIDAECFVHYENGPKGTGINFKIDGLTWSENGPLNILEAKDIKTLKAVATEARLVRKLLESK